MVLRKEALGFLSQNSMGHCQNLGSEPQGKLAEPYFSVLWSSQVPLQTRKVISAMSLRMFSTGF